MYEYIYIYVCINNCIRKTRLAKKGSYLSCIELTLDGGSGKTV